MNACLRRYVPAAGLDEHLAWYEGAGTSDRRWIVQDDLGSVIATTNASGASLAINSYDEYGAPAAANSGLFGYTGQMYLQAAGLYHYRMRAYSPALGRFLQTDPAGGLNLYAYVQNDPVNLIDPMGLDLVKPRDKPLVVTALPSRNYGRDLTLAEIDMLRDWQRGSVTPGGSGEPDEEIIVVVADPLLEASNGDSLIVFSPEVRAYLCPFPGPCIIFLPGSFFQHVMAVHGQGTTSGKPAFLEALDPLGIRLRAESVLRGGIATPGAVPFRAYIRAAYPFPQGIGQNAFTGADRTYYGMTLTVDPAGPNRHRAVSLFPSGPWN